MVAGDIALDESVQGQFNIQQNSERAVINYQNFSIGQGEAVNVVQPGENAVLLNRVVGNNLSQIAGALNANGQVFLVNPQGVMFGGGAQVNVGGLLVSTVDINTEAFMTGGLVPADSAANSNPAASIVNNADITATGANGVVFVAPIVENNGKIEAIGGDIRLSTGNGVFAQVDGSPISILLDSPHQGGLSLGGAGQGGAGQDNAGQASASGSNITNHGTLRAQRISEQGGNIVLVAEQGDAINMGTMDTAATAIGGAGDITVQANRIAQFGAITSQAGANQGDGGNVNLQGANLVEIGSQATTNVSAHNGEAGSAVFFSPNTTVMHVGAQVNASSVDGRGGYVDVSGLKHVDALGRVNVASGVGEHGTFLIDPDDITITTVDNLVTAATPFQSSASGSSTLDVATLEAALSGGGNIEVRTDVEFGDGESGHITVDSNIDLDGSNGGSLSLVADGNIIVSAGVVIADQTTATVDNTNINFTAGGAITMPDTSRVEAGTGLINFTAGSSIQVGSLTSNSTAANAITLIGVSVVDGGDTDIDLIAPNGGVTINAVSNVGSASYIETNISQLTITMAGAAPVRILEVDDLQITSLTNGQNIDLWLQSGTLTIDDPGISASGNMSIIADDLTGDLGRTLTLGANQLWLDIANPAALTTINTTVTSLDARAGGAGLDIINTGALTISDGALDVDSSGVSLEGSYLAVRTAAGDLTLASNIDLDGGNGGTLILDAGADLILPASWQVSDLTPGTVDSVALELHTANNLTLDTNVTVDVGGGTLLVNSGGDLTVTGLSSTSAANNAISLTAAGTINDAGDAATDLSAINGGIVLSAATGIPDLEIEAANLALTNSTSGDVTLHQQNSADLTISILSTVANFTLDGVTQLTLTDAANSVGGDVNITTLGAGAFTLPNTGITTTGAITLDVFDISDSDNTVLLNGASGALTLRGLTTATQLNTNFSDLTFSSPAASAISFVNSGALNVNSFAAGGDITLTTSSGDLVFTSNVDTNGSDGATWNFTAANNLDLAAAVRWEDSATASPDSITLQLTAGGALLANDIDMLDIGAGTALINTSGVAQISRLTTSSASANAIVINANRVRGNTSTTSDLRAINGGIILNTATGVTGGIGAYFEADTSNLEINLTGVGDISIDSGVDMALSGSGFDFLDIRVAGTLTLQDAGVISTGAVVIKAEDVQDTAGRALDITATDLFIQLDAMAGNLGVTTNAATLDGSVAGAGDFTFNTSASLSLLDSVEDTNTNTFLTTSGNMILSAAGDISLDAPLDINNQSGLTHSLITNNDIIFTTGNNISDSDFTIADDVNLVLQADRHIALPAGHLINTNAGTITINANNNADGTGTLQLLGQLFTTSATTSAVDIIAAQIVGDATTQTEIEATAGGIQITALDGVTNLDIETTALALTNTNSGAVTVNQQNGANLTVATLNSVGDVTLNGATNLTITDASHSIGGDLNIVTSGNGGLIVPATGLTATGAIVLNVWDITDGDTAVALTAANADLTFRGLGAATQLNTSLASLNFNNQTASTITITNNAALTLNNFSTLGDINLSTTAGDLTIANAIDLDGTNGVNWLFSAANDLDILAASVWQDSNTVTADATNISLQAGQNIQMTDGARIYAGAGLINALAGNTLFVSSLQTDSTLANAITLNAASIRDFGDSHLDIVAANGGANLTATVDIGDVSSIETELNSAAITMAAPGPVRLVELNDLNLTSLTNGTDVFVYVPNGLLTVDAAGVAVIGELNILADDITSSTGRTLTLSANTAFLDITNLGATTLFNTTFNRLDGTVAGSDFILINNGALELIDLVNDTNATAFSVTSGAMNLSTLVGDITLTNTIDLDGANGQTLQLTAANDIVFANATQISDQTPATTDNVNVQLTAANTISLNNSNSINVSGGTLLLNAGNQLTVTGLSSTSTASNAIELITNGFIDDGGEGIIDITATNGGVVLSSATSVIDSGDEFLEISSSQLAINQTAAGSANIYVDQDVALTATGLDALRLRADGTVTIEDAGLSASSDVAIFAADLTDGAGREVDIAASDLYLELTDLVADIIVNANATNLDATIDGSGGVTVNAPADLTLFDSSEDALNNSIIARSGNVTVNAGNNLTVANDLHVDDQSGQVLTLFAGNDLMFTTGANIVDGSAGAPIDNIAISLAANRHIQLPNATINSYGGTIAITADQDANGSGDVTLDAQLISTSTANNAVTIAGVNIVGDSSSDAEIVASAGGVELTASGNILGQGANQFFDVDSARLAITNVGGELRYHAINSVTLLAANNLTDANFQIDGTFTVPDTGLQSSAGLLAVTATDLIDSDRNTTINGENFLLALSNPIAATTLTTSIDSADITLPNQTLTLNETNGLILSDLNADGNALLINNGNAAINIATGDLRIANNVSLSDTLANGTRTGLFEATVSNGNINISNDGIGSTVVVQSTNTVDQTAEGGLGAGFNGNPSQTSIRFELPNNGAQTRTITIGSADSQASVIAVGGDIEIDGLGAGVANVQSSSVVVLASASQLTSYNQVDDALDGTLLLNGLATSSDAISDTNRLARTGRTIAIRPDSFVLPEPEPEPEPDPDPEPTPSPELPIENVVEVVNDMQENINADATVQPQPEKKDDADQAFDELYSSSDCSDPDKKNKGHCAIESAVKNFLSHWTVGGQLPPKVIR
ncbi:filamentous haemagglutinin-like protein [Saccharophagus degradans 2-40]|uniref:Filamentous haemagglutinin-like protein n=1 Tax=Saccharophagus degradans (strain 2-40 / ATCC 43961 / DSM 17024) TaxID=203122 RepID=Q21PQ9_SACD2|nr:filamentous haemagglutinin-like protein [Saccharophagus degradans 2-40]